MHVPKKRFRLHALQNSYVFLRKMQDLFLGVKDRHGIIDVDCDRPIMLPVLTFSHLPGIVSLLPDRRCSTRLGGPIEAVWHL